MLARHWNRTSAVWPAGDPLQTTVDRIQAQQATKSHLNAHFARAPEQWSKEKVSLLPAACSAESSKWSTLNAGQISRPVQAPWLKLLSGTETEVLRLGLMWLLCDSLLEGLKAAIQNCSATSRWWMCTTPSEVVLSTSHDALKQIHCYSPTGLPPLVRHWLVDSDFLCTFKGKFWSCNIQDASRFHHHYHYTHTIGMIRIDPAATSMM